MITVDDMMDLGLGKLLDYVDMTKDELLDFMLDRGYILLVDLCEFLSEHTVICEHCKNDYAAMENGGICVDCLDALYSTPAWR